MKKAISERKGPLQMLLCAALWSTAGIFIKQVPWNAFAISGARSAVAALVVALYIHLQHIPFQVNRRTLIPAAFMAATYICFVGANKLTTAANAIVLQFTSPVFILLFSGLFLKQHFKRADVLAVLFTLLGISLFFLDQLSPGRMLGNLVGICAGAMMAAMYVSTGEVNETERMNAVFLAQVMTALVGLPFAIATRPELALTPVVYILLLGVLQLGVPYILYARSLEQCTPLACCLLGAIEPLLNPLWVLIFDGEKPGLFALLGGAVVIVTIVVWSVRKK